MADFLAPVASVDRYQGRSKPRQRKQHGKPFCTIDEPDRYTIAGLYTLRVEPGQCLAAARVKLRDSDRAAPSKKAVDSGADSILASIKCQRLGVCSKS